MLIHINNYFTRLNINSPVISPHNHLLIAVLFYLTLDLESGHLISNDKRSIYLQYLKSWELSKLKKNVIKISSDKVSKYLYYTSFNITFVFVKILFSFI